MRNPGRRQGRKSADRRTRPPGAFLMAGPPAGCLRGMGDKGWSALCAAIRRNGDRREGAERYARLKAWACLTRAKTRKAKVRGHADGGLFPPYRRRPPGAAQSNPATERAGLRRVGRQAAGDPAGGSRIDQQDKEQENQKDRQEVENHRRQARRPARPGKPGGSLGGRLRSAPPPQTRVKARRTGGPPAAGTHIIAVLQTHQHPAL